MEFVVKGYNPQSLFAYFEQISAIPRSSGKETAIADYLVAWAAEHGIVCERDVWNNVLMRAEATEGYEDCPCVLLQGHTDMVCEKRSDVEHNFDTDPLTLCVRDGILTAQGTTLGGDDGIAVAMMMAILTEGIPHPRLECLFTSDEERGMSGAQNFDYTKITATRLINLDSEEEGVATVSCAGGARVKLDLPISRTAVPQTDGILRVSISGLSGGHSGAEIHLGKGNANELLARALMRVYEETPLQLISIAGGSKDNAITRESEAVFYTCEPARAKEMLLALEKTLRAEAVKEDRGLKIRVKKVADGMTRGMMSFADTVRVLDSILLAPTGPLTFCPDDRSLVESSANLGVLADREGSVSLTFLARSSSESRMDQLLCRYARLARLTKAEMSVHDRYPGWEYRRVSPLREDFMRVAREVYGDLLTPCASAIHAGLECGFILSAVDHDLDAISIGPDLKHIHTPEEALNLASCERLWQVVTALLAQK